MERIISIQPLDPLMIRDGRPFGRTPGVRAHTLQTVTPSVVAGTLRSLCRMKLGQSGNGCTRCSYSVSKIDVQGPLYRKGKRIFFPMPLDINFFENSITDSEISVEHAPDVKAFIKRPIQPQEQHSKLEYGFLGTGTVGLHEDKLWPVSMPVHMTKPYKSTPAYLSSELLISWLCDELDEKGWASEIHSWQKGRTTPTHAYFNEQEHFMAPFPRETRTHTAIDESTKAAKDQQLFSTESIVLPPDVSLIARLNPPDKIRFQEKIDEVHSLGGKRRLAHFQDVTEDESTQKIWSCPDRVVEAVRKSVGNQSKPTYLRMVLATPAFFSKGWIPGWLNENLVSTDKLALHDKAADIKLQLRWACVPRWEAVSGWSYRKREPKAVRRMVPAGSVYFFEVQDGDPVEFVKQYWLQSMSDKDRRLAFFDKQDGYGLATWGIWTPEQSFEGEGQ